MDIQGSSLISPFRADQRGTLAVVSKRSDIVEESIRSIVETRQGERVMLPDYGIPDWVFSVMDSGLAARVAYFVEQQLLKYEPLIEQATARIGALVDDRFVPGFVEDQQIAAVSIEYIERGSNAPRNLVFPTWLLASGLGNLS